MMSYANKGDFIFAPGAPELKQDKQDRFVC